MNKNRLGAFEAQAPDLLQRESRRPTRLIVDLGAIEQNARIICQQVSAGTQLMAVVKADGYGHNAVACARSAALGGATYLGVATVREGEDLRAAGLALPILVLGPSDPGEVERAANAGLSIGVGDAAQAANILEFCSRMPPSNTLRVHLKIDTGMRRFGVSPEEAPFVARLLSENPNVELEGTYSHFAEADAEDMVRIEAQLQIFQMVLEQLRAVSIDPGLIHLANSAGLLKSRTSDFDMVRAGICLYGIEPSAAAPLFPGMRSALRWLVSVAHITTIAPGDRIGYGGTYVASEHERIALLPVGYADGFPRALSGLGWAIWRGERLPIRGRVSMDQTAVGIPPGIDLRLGDEVTLIGSDSECGPTANEVGSLIDTIGYEIVSRISKRVPVEFIESPLEGMSATPSIGTQMKKTAP